MNWEIKGLTILPGPSLWVTVISQVSRSENGHSETWTHELSRWTTQRALDLALRTMGLEVLGPAGRARVGKTLGVLVSFLLSR